MGDFYEVAQTKLAAQIPPNKQRLHELAVARAQAIAKHLMASEIAMCKEFNYSVANKLNNKIYAVKEATMSKLLSTKMADKVIYDCLQLLGGYGYMEDYPLARLLRDSRIGTIGGGTSEILKEVIAKIVIDKKQYNKTT